MVAIDEANIVPVAAIERGAENNPLDSSFRSLRVDAELPFRRAVLRVPPPQAGLQAGRDEAAHVRRRIARQAWEFVPDSAP